MEPIRTSLLIAGAGPFGLALAASARAAGIDGVVCGRAMAFWREHMPAGMFLRSGPDWHLDTAGAHTMDAFLAERGIEPAQATPLSLDRYLEYVEWFQKAKGIEPIPSTIVCLDRAERFVATLDDGRRIEADAVALAIGFQYFAHVPPRLADLIPPSYRTHTCACVDLRSLAGQRCLIVGGRQSAFEWAALLGEAGASEVHVSYRHETPRFVESDWSWVPGVVARFVSEPGWYRRLTDAERADLNARLWTEGRLKLEPWLAPRLASPAIALHPGTEVTDASDRGDALAVTLSDGTAIAVDRVILATGYKPDLRRVPFLRGTPLLDAMALRDGCPELDDHLQSSIAGLYVTSMAATATFGSFFAFTVSARASAELITRHIAAASITG
jgi:cation diffusion facilitator CzcD-associated flavoprotein CzcO